MTSILVTGSADGLGRATAKTLLAEGYSVIVHARSPKRLEAVRELLDQGALAVSGDLSDQKQTRNLADQVNALGEIEAVIHNAGVYTGTAVMPVNIVAPYLLTTLIQRPRRIVYLSSGMHLSGRPVLENIDWSGQRASGSYSDSKLFVTAFAAAVARRWPETISSAVNPGWVPTKMGGPNAPDDLRLGHLTQEWLVTSKDAKALISGGYWFHQKQVAPHPASQDPAFQEELLQTLERVTGIAFS